MMKDELDKSIPANQSIDITATYDKYKFWQQSHDPYTKGIPVAFLTTPVMNLTKKNSSRVPYFSHMRDNYPSIYKSLTCWNPETDEVEMKSSSPFIRILSNSFKGLTGKDLNAKTIDVGESFYGYKQVLPGPYIDSIVGDTLSVKYSDSKDLHVIRLHKLWMDYIELVSRGVFSPYDDIVKHSEIDFVSTLYYFVLDMDMETILYYSRYVGVTPISNPYSVLTASVGDTRDIPEIDIEYAYSYKQDLEPEILVEFNKLSQHDYTELRGFNNTAVSYEIPQYSTIASRHGVTNGVISDGGMTDVMDKINRTKFFENPIVYQQKNPDIKQKNSGIVPNTIYKLVYTK